MARDRHLGIRLSDEELDRIATLAAAAAQTPAAWLRSLASAPPAPSPEQRALRAAPGCLSRPVSTRLAPAQYEEVAARARACGVSLGAYLRLAVLGVTPVIRPGRADVRPALAALNRVGNNLNQLAKLAHQGMPLPADVAASRRRGPRRGPARAGRHPRGRGVIVFKGGSLSSSGGRSGTGKSFGGLVSYLQNGHRESADPDRVAWSSTRNLDNLEDPRLVARVMRAHAEQNPRVERPVYHFGLSLAEGEHLTRDEWNAAVGSSPRPDGPRGAPGPRDRPRRHEQGACARRRQPGRRGLPGVERPAGHGQGHTRPRARSSASTTSGRPAGGSTRRPSCRRRRIRRPAGPAGSRSPTG